MLYIFDNAFIFGFRMRQIVISTVNRFVDMLS